MNDPQPPATSPYNLESSGVDLTSIITPIGELLGFYDDLIADRNPPIERLDNAVRQIKDLPPIGGLLGHDLAMIADGGRGAPRHEIIRSLQRLRSLTTQAPHPTDPISKPPDPTPKPDTGPTAA